MAAIAHAFRRPSVARTLLLGGLIVLQLIAVIGFIVVLSARWAAILTTLNVLSAAVAITVVVREENPSYKVSWIIAIMLFPLLGGLFYLAWGNKGIPKKERLQMRQHIKSRPQIFPRSNGGNIGLGSGNPGLDVQSAYIYHITGFQAFDSTTAKYCPLGENQLRLMMQELPQAKKFILLEYFIIEQGVMWNSILDILLERVSAGVEVLVLYDDVGCMQTLPPGYDRHLQNMGIRCAVFNPMRASLKAAVNYRDHRKICVIDGHTGFCGGINLADEYINVKEKHGHWKDTAVMLKGPGVYSLTQIFLQNWSFSTGETQEELSRFLIMPPNKEAKGWVQSYSDTPLDRWNVAENVYLQIISRANRYVYITTPYLILDNEMVTVLRCAAQSGIDVRIITPHIADKWYVHRVTRSYYRPLIAAGVKIYEYLPGFIHAKMFISDDQVAVVGTANLDYRSLYLHYECAVAFFEAPIVEEVKRDVLDTIEQSQLITREELDAESQWKRFVSSLLRLFAPFM